MQTKIISECVVVAMMFVAVTMISGLGIAAGCSAFAASAIVLISCIRGD